MISQPMPTEYGICQMKNWQKIYVYCWIAESAQHSKLVMWEVCAMQTYLNGFNQKQNRREIMEDRYLFKAKRLDNGEWVKGALFDGESHCIIGQEIKFSPYTEHECKIVGYEVDRNTICQCTGEKDRNDKLIWENDIVRDRYGNFYKAFWQDNYYQFSWICVKSDVFSIGAKWNLWSFKSFEIEVTGNIFDNPELESEG